MNSYDLLIWPLEYFKLKPSLNCRQLSSSFYKLILLFEVTSTLTLLLVSYNLKEI